MGLISYGDLFLLDAAYIVLLFSHGIPVLLLCCCVI